MSRRIPSLKALSCFEQTARYGSASRAAEELYLTQSAVSRQIQGLETWLGCKLFAREKQRLVLTPEGESYLQSIRPALDQLESATLTVLSGGSESGVLTVAAPPTFGSRCLIPLLPQFRAKHPDIAINFISRIGMPDFDREQIDIAVLFGQGTWNDLDAHILHGEEMVPICSPQLIANLDHPASPDDLRHFPLLHIATRPRGWADWLMASGLTDIDGENGPKFEHFTMAMQAAAAGLGVALLPTFAIEDELRSGRIVAPFGPPKASPFHYYACSPATRTRLPKIRAFMNWLDQLDTAAQLAAKTSKTDH
ncbi:MULTISPECIES: transcriptional regulator GcvA [Thalassospira]|uniref:LysR family transcriptional regulator n=2 Tax=Thalassospira TaxID=168934 RepID=A0A367WEB2_9PROT|nr:MULTISPECIES: transcriptional regulator GcvA [Thalassospira]MDG4717625.1 transcriptional regulator GcvA [Thalassospira sp. FZY0004]RCK38911.1 LysR family transcriptional regulator [Thalassospira profundimaris]